jgi:hypothetical protein
LKVKLKGILDGTASWVRLLEDGRVELEYFDFSPAAQDTFGNDVAWMYRIDAAHKPRLYELLGVSDDDAMLNALAWNFGDVMLIHDWLLEKQIPFEKEFDSWA